MRALCCLVGVPLIRNAGLDCRVEITSILGEAAGDMLNFAMLANGVNARFKGRVIGACEEDIAGNKCLLAHTTDVNRF